MWFSRRTEKLSLFNCVGNEETLHKVREESNSVHKINRRKCNFIGHILLWNCLIEHDIAWKEIRKFRSERKIAKKT